MKHVLVIAGSDPSGGAGVQADLTTLKDFGVPSIFAITALTAQNDQRVLQIHPTPADILTQQLSAACDGRFVGAVKIGMVAEGSIVMALVWFLNARHFPNIVIDPILHSSSGTPLLEKRAYTHLRQQLLPLATVITPNLEEAGTFAGLNIYNEETQIKAAKRIYDDVKILRAGRFPEKPLAIIVKGGHLEGEAIDVFYDGKDVKVFRAARIPGPSPRGTGCRFSSAIAAGLSKGSSLPDAVKAAKDYLTQYIQQHMKTAFVPR
ncbi:MAG: bifunctional hydroxymethylpyrimidine kinase/phosphomethylpyrimidine kinase [Deltaproteobacteria bacterium]|nr:bifunctional hydroxymethylpyrimidine kinase/phosphomethylpyrimidine kinase [Deltaproteobacteria bacterium]